MNFSHVTNDAAFAGQFIDMHRMQALAWVLGAFVMLLGIKWKSTLLQNWTFGGGIPSPVAVHHSPDRSDTAGSKMGEMGEHTRPWIAAYKTNLYIIANVL